VESVATQHHETSIREELLDHVQRRLSSLHPDIQLESPIQGWAYLDEFRKGIEAYKRIGNPTATDDRWLGVCHFQLLDDMRALEAFYRAAARGAVAARINLAHLLRFLERGEEGAKELRSIRPSDLNAYDRVFLLRVTSLDEENNGNLREALRTAEDAWKLVQGIPEFGLLAPSILAQLGILHGRIGRSQRALWFLERGLQITSGLERKKVQLRRVPVLASLGRLNEAAAELAAIGNADLPDSYSAELDMLSGEIEWAKGNLDGATLSFQRCLGSASRLQVTYEEFVARISLVALSATGRECTGAAEHLSRAQSLISDKSDRLAYRFREIGLRLRAQEYTPEHALKEYDALDAEFGTMGLLQEQGFVKLHTAALLLRLDPRRSAKVLDDLQSLCVMLQNHAFLAKEWALLPELKREAMRSHAELLGGQTEILEVRSLGDEGLYHAGERLAIPLRRLVEVVAYFLEYKAVSLTKLLADVFPDEKPRSAKSYFHQCRHQLKEYLPPVQIEFDREARMYRLRSQIDIVWDVAEVRAGRRDGDFGLFLPSSGNDWALMLDHGLDRFRAATPEREREAVLSR
jgi:hypothetical protein